MSKGNSNSKLRYNIHERMQEFFDDVIFERGLDYFYEDRVQEVCRRKGNFYSTVEGTYPYNVRIEIKDNDIEDMYCNCPYADEGYHCKHMAATLIYIEQNLESILTDKDIEKQIAKRTKEIEKHLSNISDQQLRQYIADIALDNENIYSDLRTMSTMNNFHIVK